MKAGIRRRGNLKFAARGLKLQITAGFGTEMHPMKKIFSIFTALLVAAAVRAALPAPDLIARIHFAGAQKFAATPGAAFFNNEFSSAEALALRQQTADKLAPWLAGWLQKNSGAPGAGGAALRPLLDDLQTSEWFLDAHNVGGKPSGVFAVKLEPARLQLWRASLQSLPFEVSDSRGWLFCLFGNSVGKLGDLQPPAPITGVLDLDINWPCLAQWYPKLKELGLPETQFAVTAAADNNFHINGKFFFPENLALKLDPWRVPTNIVHQPFVSFTAVRGFAAWLQSQPWASACNISPEPNELFTWALPQSPFQTFAAVLVPDAADALTQLYARLQPALASANAAGAFFRPLTMTRTNTEIHFAGTPFIAPFIRAVNDASGQFLMAGVFPNTARSKPLPPELFARLAQPNLLFYHWEITAVRMGDRFDQLPQFTQLVLMLTSHRQLGGESAGMKWLRKFTPALGNTVTEIFSTGPAEMSFTRTAPGGLTAAEILALASWLEAPDFPGCNLKIQRPAKRLHPVPAVPAPPAAK